MITDILIIYTKSPNFSIVNIFKPLVKSLNYYETIEAFLNEKSKDFSKFDFVLLEGNLFFTLSKEQQEQIMDIFKNIKIVFGGEFSESYLFSKSLKYKCDEFIVTPFGLKEAKSLIERLDFL